MPTPFYDRDHREWAWYCAGRAPDGEWCIDETLFYALPIRDRDDGCGCKWFDRISVNYRSKAAAMLAYDEARARVMQDDGRYRRGR